MEDYLEIKEDYTEIKENMSSEELKDVLEEMKTRIADVECQAISNDYATEIDGMKYEIEDTIRDVNKLNDRCDEMESDAERHYDEFIDSDEFFMKSFNEIHKEDYETNEKNKKKFFKLNKDNIKLKKDVVRLKEDNIKLKRNIDNIFLFLENSDIRIITNAEEIKKKFQQSV